MNKPLVLIIDDMADNVRLLGDALASMCRVQFATSGEEGLQMIARQPPDLILLDVMMPGMSGYEVYSQLKTEQATEEVPVIFVTARSDPASESEAILAGAADFIHKPVNVDVVRARVRMQLELARHRRDLQKLVLERTAQLATARAEAESANAVKTRFMTNVSHEMRTPLHGILGYAELGRKCAEQPGEEKYAGYFAKVMESGQRLHALVESLLTLAEDAWRVQAGDGAGTIGEIDLAGFVDEIVALATLRAAARRQQLVLEMAASRRHFAGDVIRLRQVLEHLLANAIAYSPEAARVILRIEDRQLRFGRNARAEPALSLQVIDEGCGIPENELQAVFEPFYQSSRTASGAGGTGLGLPLCRCIVQRHRGQLRLSNRAEGGVIAEILLPAELPAEESSSGGSGLR